MANKRLAMVWTLELMILYLSEFNEYLNNIYLYWNCLETNNPLCVDREKGVVPGMETFFLFAV